MNNTTSPTTSLPRPTANNVTAATSAPARATGFSKGTANVVGMAAASAANDIAPPADTHNTLINHLNTSVSLSTPTAHPFNHSTAPHSLAANTTVSSPHHTATASLMSETLPMTATNTLTALQERRKRRRQHWQDKIRTATHSSTTTTATTPGHYKTTTVCSQPPTGSSILNRCTSTTSSAFHPQAAAHTLFPLLTSAHLISHSSSANTHLPSPDATPSRTMTRNQKKRAKWKEKIRARFAPLPLSAPLSDTANTVNTTGSAITSTPRHNAMMVSLPTPPHASTVPLPSPQFLLPVRSVSCTSAVNVAASALARAAGVSQEAAIVAGTAAASAANDVHPRSDNSTVPNDLEEWERRWFPFLHKAISSLPSAGFGVLMMQSLFVSRIDLIGKDYGNPIRQL